MTSDDSEERFLILKFSDQENLKEFFSLFQDSGLGKLHKVGSDPDGRNNKKKKNNGGNKKTTWSSLGLKSYDEKSAEKTSLS